MRKRKLNLKWKGNSPWEGLLRVVATGNLHLTCAVVQAPALLEELFNGMIWTSKSASTTEEGVIRVNYYVRYTQKCTHTHTHTQWKNIRPLMQLIKSSKSLIKITECFVWSLWPLRMICWSHPSLPIRAILMLKGKSWITRHYPHMTLEKYEYHDYRSNPAGNCMHLHR